MKRHPDDFMSAKGFSTSKRRQVDLQVPSTSSSSTTPRESLNDVMADMFLSNKLSGKDVSRLASASFAEGNHLSMSLAKVGAWGSQPKNFARDVMHQLLKNVDMPQLFWWKVTLWDQEKAAKDTVAFPFLLPHEMVNSFVSKHTFQKFALESTVQHEAFKLHAELCSKAKLALAKTLALGLHGDGVPFTKTDSLEMLTFNFLALPKADRIPITGVSKKHLCKCGCKGQCTWRDIFSVIKWSLMCLMTGVVLNFLPDGSPWPGDGLRELRPGFKLLCHGLLEQVRGDWPFLRTMFNFPAWNSERICWKCKACRSEGPSCYKEVQAEAMWRQQRQNHSHYIAETLSKQVVLNPLFDLPYFTVALVVLDWLHIVDLGVTQDMVGNFFYECISFLLPGSTQAERLKKLWKDLKEWYNESKPPSRLDNLTLEMIKGKDKLKPKLRSKAAEARYLVPFASMYSEKFRSRNDHCTVIADAFWHLLQLQLFVSKVFPWDAAKAAEHCRKLCILFKSLEAEAAAKGRSNCWNLKPKVHLLQEMIEFDAPAAGNPADYWCYRDESFCGFWAKASKRRGGHNLAATTAQRFLDRYRALHKPIELE